MEVCFRPCLDYKSHFAAASLLARSTELRGKINLLFKARPDKDSYQVSLKGTLIWKSSAATFHLFAITAEQGWELGGAGIPFPPQMSFSWFSRMFSSPSAGTTRDAVCSLWKVQTCLYTLLLCCAEKQSPSFKTCTCSWEIWRETCFAADRSDLVKSHRLTPFLRAKNQNSWLGYTSKKGS